MDDIKTFDPDSKSLIDEVVPISRGTGGMLVGRRHSENGIKAFNSSTGQGLEMEGGEVVITRDAVSDPTKREFDGQLLTNREILSKINESGGGVSFTEGGDIPVKINVLDKAISIDGKTTTDTMFAQSLGCNSTLKKGGQIFTVGNRSYHIEKAYKLIHDGRIDHRIMEIDTFPIKDRILSKDFEGKLENQNLPQGLMVKADGEDVLIDGNHRMDHAYKTGSKNVKVYYVADPKMIEKFRMQ
jgi:hypothetical protein